MIASLLGPIEDRGKDALKAVNDDREALRINEFEVGVAFEVTNSILERLKSVRHVQRLPYKCSMVKH